MAGVTSYKNNAIARLLDTVRARLRRSRLWRMLTWSLGLPLVALVLMMATNAIPDRPIASNLLEGVQRGDISTNYPHGYTVRKIDRFSECKRITVGMGAPPSDSLLTSAVRSPTLGDCELAVPRIVGWGDGQGLKRAFNYSRYWNGSAVVFRPSVAAFGVAGSRVLAGFATIAATMLLWREMRRRVGKTAAVVFVVPLVTMTGFVDLPGALLHALAWTIALGTAWAVVRHANGQSSAGLFEWSFVSGATFLFLADLTNPDMAWFLVVGMVALTSLVNGHRARSVLIRAAAAAGGWIIGFAWLWLTKWVLYAMVAGWSTAWDDVFGQIGYRVGDTTYAGPVGLLDPLEAVVLDWWRIPLTPVTILVLWFGLSVLLGARGVRRFNTAHLAALSPVVLIPLWYFVLRNHTFTHSWFVYRSFAAGIAYIATILAVALLPEHLAHPPTAPLASGAKDVIADDADTRG